MLVKEYMSHTCLSQHPMKILSQNKLKDLPLSGPQDLTSRNVLNEKLVKEYRKTANMVEQAPWFLHRAADYLRTWTANNENDVQEPGPYFVFEARSDSAQQDQPALTAEHKLLQEFAPDPPKIVTVEQGPPPRAEAKAKAKAKPAAPKPNPKAKAKALATKAKSKAQAKPKAKAKAKATANAKATAKAKAKALGKRKRSDAETQSCFRAFLCLT